MFSKLALVAGLVVVTSGCTVYTNEEPATPGAPPPAYDNPGTPVARPNPSNPSRQERWEKLGEGVANGRNDRDVVPVGRAEGTFRAIRLKVERSSVRMNDLIVHFTDGTKYSFGRPVVFREGDTTTAIDLPGGRRAIRSIEFRYTDSASGGPSVVEVWGI
jgi:hypothetical protein